MTRRISRRRAFRYGAVAAMALTTPWWLQGTTEGQSGSGELPQPNVLKSSNGQLSLTLTCRQGTVDLGAAKPVSTYTYDNVVPGYTWELEPGDTLNVNLTNNLPVTPAYASGASSFITGNADLGRFACASPFNGQLFDGAPPRPHQVTNTNLHTHGLHVSPSGNADNIFLDIPPGGTQQFQIPLPSDHPGGLFWYHPHRHGAVTQQVRAGMAGAIIVRGDIDDVPEVRAAKEQLMVVQAIELGSDFQLMDVIPAPTLSEAFFPRKQILYTVNGALTPRVTMYPGEVQRWRLLNAAEGKFMSLRLEGHGFNVLAWDGLNLAAPDPVDSLDIPAGGRVDVLVRASAAGTYSFILTPSSSARLSEPGLPDLPAEFRTRPILTVDVTGSGPQMKLPATLPVFDPPILPIARTRYFEYTVERHPDDTFLSFGVNGIPFDLERPPYQMRLDTAEEWTLVNAHDHKLPRHAHGLHIHTNPIKITAINGTRLSKPLWRDTYELNGADGNSLTFVSNFVDFTGKFVEHCHVLSHEDLGMMESLEVIP